MKRVLMWLIVILMTLAGAAAANAKQVKKHRKAKQTAPITAVAPAPEPIVQPAPVAPPVPEVPPPAENPNVGYKGGFFIKSPDNKFKFVMNGRVQPLVYYSKTTDQPGAWSFRVRRARLDFTAVIFEKASINVSLQHSTKSAKYSYVNLTNATATYEIDPAFVLTAGTVGMPLSIIGATSSLGLFLIDPPLVITQEDGGNITPLRSSFGNPDGLGIMFNGEISKFFYEFAVVNGAAAPKAALIDVNGKTIEGPSGGVESNYDLNFNKRVSVGARVGWNILDPVHGMEMDLPYSEKPKLTVSMGGDYQGKREDPVTNAVVNRIITGSVGGAFRWRGLSLNAEVFGRKTKLDDPGTAVWFSMNMDDFGYYLDGGYFIVPNRFELAAVGSQIFREGPSNNSYQFGGAANWYINGTKTLKLQLAYTLTASFDDEVGNKARKSNNVSLMLTTAF